MDGTENGGLRDAHQPAVSGSDSTSGAEPAAPPLPGLFARIPLLLFEPTKLFRALRARPVVLGALVLSAVIIAIAMAIIPMELVQEDSRRRVEAMQETMRSRGVEIPEDAQVPQEGNARLSKIMMIVGPLVGLPIGLMIGAGVLLLIFRSAMGYEGSFRQYLSVSAHAQILMALGTLLIVPLQISAGRLDLTLSLGAFLPFLGDGFLAGFLGRINLFTVWGAVLVGIGVSVVDGKRSPAGAISILVGILVFFAAVGALMGGITGG